MKIALVNVMFFDEGTRVAYGQQLLELSDAFFRTAKKYFLRDHDVECVVLTNEDVHVHTEGVRVVRVDYPVHGLYHILTMKVLGIEFLGNEYDYIFVADCDQIFVNEVTDDDVLTTEFNILQHFYQPTFSSVLPDMTTVLPDPTGGSVLCGWTMGNFYGGSARVMSRLAEYAKHIHFDNYPHNVTDNHGYYCKFADEYFLSTYAHLHEPNHQLLTSTTNPYNDVTKQFFLSDFFEDEGEYPLYKTITNVKLLHNTKKNMSQLDTVLPLFTLD